MSAPITILVIDDDPLARSALTSHFDADPRFLVLTTGRDGLEAIEISRRHCPDVIIMDTQMPKLDGMAATARIRKAHPQIRVLLLTVLHDEKEAREGIESGASGYLPKDASPEVILEAALAVHHGAAILPENLLGPVSATRHASETAALQDKLTPRESEVLTLLCEGASNKEIATRLYTSESTVKTHVARIMTKLGATSRTKAVVRAYKLGLADD